VFRVVEQTSHAFFTIVGWVMKLAPLGAFGAMAYIIGQYGIGSLSSYGMLIACCYLAAVLFIGVLAAISWFFAGINLWMFLRYIKDEMFLALGTASTEVVLPRIMVKLTNAGCSRATTGWWSPPGTRSTWTARPSTCPSACSSWPRPSASTSAWASSSPPCWC
jgi:aerobic C4-dicarboxylate transport protein